MKFRAVMTTSERELILALKTGGRHVSLAQLSDWRKEGLLPPLASRGLGPNRGRCYYWDQDNILEHAQCVHDLLQRHHRHSVVIQILWLCGHSVPLAKVRRAWLRHASGARSWQIRVAPGKTAPPPVRELPAGSPSDAVLLKTILKLSGSLAAGRRPDSDALYETLQRTADKLGYESQAGGIQYHLFIALRLIIAAIENSSLLQNAKDDELEAARRMTEIAARLVQSVTGGEKQADFETGLSRRMEIVGESFFLCALLLQRTGYREHLSRSGAAIETLLLQLAGSGDAGRPRLFRAFRDRLAEIWESLPGEEVSASERTKSKTARRLKAGLAVCLGLAMGAPAQLCSGGLPGIVAALSA